MSCEIRSAQYLVMLLLLEIPGHIYWNSAIVLKISWPYSDSVCIWWLCLASQFTAQFHTQSRLACACPSVTLVTLLLCNALQRLDVRQAYPPFTPLCRLGWFQLSPDIRWHLIGQFWLYSPIPFWNFMNLLQSWGSICADTFGPAFSFSEAGWTICMRIDLECSVT